MSGFDLSAPLAGTLSSKPRGKDSNYDKLMDQSLDTTIDMLFKVLIAQAQNIIPGEEGQGTQFANSLVSVAGTIQQAQSNDLAKKNNSLQKGMYISSMMNFEGQDIEFESNIMEFNGEETFIGYRLPREAEGGVLSILDMNGETVQEFLIKGKGKKDAISWDGKDSDGQDVPSGQYTIRVEGLDDKNQKVMGQSFVRDRVDGIEFDERDIPHLLSGKRAVNEIYSYYPHREAQKRTVPSVDATI